MVSVNTIVGNIANIEYNSATNGKKAFARFTVAVNTIVNKEKRADFYQVVAFDTTADFLNKYFHKGKAIMVDSRLRMNKSEYKGQVFNQLQLVASQISFVPSSGDKDRPVTNQDANHVEQDFIDSITG